MRSIALWLALLTSVAFAQPLDYSTGGNLKRRQYQTYSALTYYVDPIGSDSNACTASGTAACLTLGAVAQKVPIHIRHLVTVNVATGTYAEVFRLQDFFIEGANGAASTAALNITGTQAAFIVATGSNTGTVSTYVAAIGGAHALLNDSTQTWTVNDLRGRYVTITSGTGNGEYHLITSNTATQLSLAVGFTAAPTGSSVYAIRSPGPVFTGTQGTVRGIMGGGTITLTDISIQPSSGAAFNATGMTGMLTMTRVRLVGTSSGITALVDPRTGPQRWSMNQTLVSAGAGSAFAIPVGTAISATELFVRCSAATCAGSGIFNAVTSSTITMTGTIAGDFTGGLFLIQSSLGMQSTGLWFDCGANTNTAISLAVSTDSSAKYTGSAWAQNTGPYINGCGTGYSLNQPSLSYIDNSTVFTNTTNAITLTAGARAVIEASTTFTGGTNFLTLDGTAYTDADLTAFTRITGPQGSYATRP